MPFCAEQQQPAGLALPLLQKSKSRSRSWLLFRTTATATKPNSAVQVKDKAGKANGRWTKGRESNSHGHMNSIQPQVRALLRAKHLTVSWHLAFVSSVLVRTLSDSLLCFVLGLYRQKLLVITDL